MENFAPLLAGFSAALSPENLLWALIGCVLGTIVGVLPGIGPTAGLAILLTVTNTLPPVPAIIMLAAIFYGAMYGGSTTSILMNIPGEISSVVTAIDGYEMTRQGRAGAALAIAAIGSFLAGTVGLLGLTLFSPVLAEMALKMGPPEVFALLVFSFTMVAGMSGASMLKGITAAAIGMLIAMIGLDPTTGVKRFTFGTVMLTGGLDIIAILMGLFAVKEVLKTIGEGVPSISSVPLPPWHKMIKWDDVKASTPAFFRSSLLGFSLGCIPGMSPGVITFMAYDVEKRFSKNRGNFGKGAVEGVAAPEAANNAAASGGFVPLFALGIPPHASLAVLMGGLMIYGLQPGPLIFQKQPDFIWAVIASMYIGNVILLVLNLPLVGLWAKVMKVPYYYIAPVILLFCFIGTYSVRNSFFDVGTCLAFGFIGLLMDRLRVPALPLVLTVILTPMLEDSLRQSLGMGAGSMEIFLARPIALVFFGISVVALSFILYARSRGAEAQRDLSP